MTETARPNNGPWSTEEVRALRDNASQGAATLALILGRSEASIWSAAKRYRVSLRRRGETRGKILGQRGPWDDPTNGIDATRLALIRSDVLAGTVDIGILEARIRDTHHGPRRPLCPGCGQRSQERTSTGLCEVCHLRELARAHRDEVERREARRELWQARQDKHRRRKRTES